MISSPSFIKGMPLANVSIVFKDSNRVMLTSKVLEIDHKVSPFWTT